MKHRQSLVLCGILAVSVLCLAIAGPAAAQTALINGDFESGDLTGWLLAGGNADATATVETTDNGPTLPGTHDVLLANFGQAVGLTLKQTSEPGTGAPGDVSWSFDLKLDQADVGGVLFVEIFAEQVGVGIVGGSGLMGPFWPWNAWTNYNGSFVAPAGTDFLTIQFTATTGAATGSSCVAHVDNVVLNAVNAVPNDTESWGGVKALFR